MQQALARHQEAINNHQCQVNSALASAGGKVSDVLINKTINCLQLQSPASL